MKRSVFFTVLFLSCCAFAGSDQISTGVKETTNYAQTIGLSVCGLGGVVGAIMLAFNNESGSSWIAKALIGACALGAVPFAVMAIGGFFGIG